MSSSKRTSLIIMLIAAAGAFAFYRSDTFWGIFVCGLAFIWTAFTLLPIMDAGWRLRLGFAIAALVGAFVALWPTLDNISDGKIRVPTYVRDRVTFAIAPGLDLRGGLRLVYTVEVEE